jgi:hypothetical protein
VIPFAVIDWGPVAIWAGASGTVLVASVSALAALGWFERFHRPRLRIDFEQCEPWCRRAFSRDEREGLWVRVAVENIGRYPARGCVGRLIAVTTGGQPRPDIDPLRLRWAGFPDSRATGPVDLRRDQREFLNVLFLEDFGPWNIISFDDDDFHPGFTTDLDPRGRHVVDVAIFSDNAPTVVRSVGIEPDVRDGRLTLRLMD